MEAIVRRNFLKMFSLGVISPAISGFTVASEPTAIFPKRLNSKSLIGVLAPAAAYFSDENLANFLIKLESLGYRYKLGKNINRRYGYLAGKDKERAEDFMSMIEDTDVEAIVAIRGGWGTARILPYLDFKTIANNPKIVMGFSDVTALLNAISSQTGIVTYHGPVAVSDWNNEFTLTHFDKIFIKGEKILMNEAPAEVSRFVINSGTAKGTIFGGNLSVLSDLIGTNYLPNWKDKILFLEDVTEDIFRIDRMLTQMRLAGIFDDVSGIVFATCDKCIAPEPEKSLTLEEVLNDNLKPCGKPAFFGLKIGHIADKYIVPIGLKAQLDADEFSLRLLEQPVRS